jgi:hypothetical protein
MDSSIVDGCNPSIRTEYPYLIEKCSTVTIEIEDNIKFKICFEDKNEELRKEETFASILEYLPYRKSDWTFVFKN